jgi:hypothetical protein
MLSPFCGITKEMMSQGPQVAVMKCRETTCVGFLLFYLGFFIGSPDPTLLSEIDPSSDLISSQQNPSKTIDPSGRPEGNATHRVNCTVSLEITLWVDAILRCL